MSPETLEDLLQRNRELQSRLEEAEETLRALRNGEVDAFVASGPDGDRVYTLKGADEAYKIMVQDMAEGALTLTLDGLILFSNEQFASMVGISLERVIGSPIQDFVVPEDAPLLSALLTGRDGGKAGVRLKLHETRSVPVYLSVNTLVFDGVECVCAIVTDLTEQKRNEEIVAAEMLARSILEQAAGAILVVNPTGKIIRASRAAERLANARVVLHQFNSVFPLHANAGSKAYAFEEILSHVQRNGDIAGLEASALMAGGRALDLLVNASLLTNPDSEVLGCIVNLNDVTGIKRAEQERERLLAQYQTVLGSITEGVVVADSQGNLVSMNPAALAIHGFQSIDQVRRNMMEFEGTFELFDMDGHSLPMKESPMARALRGEAFSDFEVRVVRKDTGKSWTGSYSGVAARNEAGEIVHVIVLRDITERKQSEVRLRQAQKMESIGLLAGGIAHDFNNLLTGIMGNASLVIGEVAPDVAETLQGIVSSAERAAHLTRQLLAYSGKGQFLIKHLNLSRAVREITDLVHLSIPKRVELRLDVRERLPLVEMDPGQLQQIVMNLVINAGEAIGEGHAGKVTVSTDVCDLDRAFVDALGEDVVAGRYVCLEVTDTGPGIDPTIMAKIFDPFFTTKFTGRGLGLAAVSGIVRSQKGAITVQSVPGQGSTFRVFFRTAAQTGRKQIEQEPLGISRGTVLVVDDEESVRKFISAVLRKNGYLVLEASDGSEALALFESKQTEFGIIIVDLVMPIMGGGEFLAQLKGHRPDLKVLLTSGYSESEARRLCNSYEGAAFIQKPYTAQQLALAVETLSRSSK